MQDKRKTEGQPRRPAAEAVSRIDAGLGDLWWWFLARGVLAGLLGLALLVWPSWSVEVLAVVLGLFLLIDGVAGLIGTMRARQTAISLTPALISIVVGGVLLLWPGATLRMLLIVVGIWAIASGVGYLMSGRGADATGPANGNLKTIGITVTIVGVILFFWPGTGIVTVAWVLAAAAFAIALVLLFVAFRLKGLKDRIGERA
ncbi:MAG: DUF308 domain-containing protein [Geminicoccaceae bacterium]